MTETTRYAVGGTVQADGGLYIAREADRRLLELCRRGTFAYVLTTRQVGKSSLMVNTAESLVSEGIHSIIIDLTQLGTPTTTEQWYLGLLENVEEQLELTTDLHEWWPAHAELSYTQRLTTFLEQVMLAEVPGRIVIFLDEIDSTLRLDFRDDFFAAIRYCYNARASRPALGRVSFVLLGVATPAELIADPTRTPFNVGERVELDDFTAEQARPLAAGLRLPEPQSLQVLDWILAWTSGHPYLTVKLCAEIAGRDSFVVSRAGVEAVVRETFMVPQREDSNILYVRHALTERADLEQRDAVLYAYRDVIRARGRPRVRDDAQSPVVANLKLSGAVVAWGGYLVVRNLIYTYVFTLKWVNALLPFRRWWDGVPKGIKIAAAIIVCLLFTSVGFAAYAGLQTQEALDQAAIAQSGRLAYQSEQVLGEGNDELGLLLAIEAGNSWDQMDAYGSIRRALTLRGRTQLLLSQLATFAMWSEDESRILTHRNDGIIRVWDATSGVELLTLHQRDHETGLFPQVSWNGDSSKILATSSGGIVQVWDATTGTELLTLHHKRARASLNEDESLILTTDLDGTVRVWNAATGVELFALQHEGRHVTQMIWNKDNSQIMTISNIISSFYEGTVHVWDAATGMEILALHLDNNISQASWSQDESRILTASIDGYVRAWEATTGVEVLALRHAAQECSTGFNDNLNCVWDDNRSRILTLSEEGIVHISDANSGKSLLAISHEDAITRANWNEDGSRIITIGSDQSVRVWDTTTGKELLKLSPGGEVSRASWNNDESLIMTTSHLMSGSGLFRVWNATTGEAQLAIPTNGFARVVDMNENYIVLDDESQRTMILNAKTGAKLLTLDERVIELSTQSGYENLILTINQAGQIRVRDIMGGTELLTLPHSNQITRLIWNEDKSRFLSASFDGNVTIWDTETVSELTSVEVLGYVTMGADLNRNGSRLLSATYPGGIQIWDATTGKELLQIPGTSYGNFSWKSASWSPDESRFLTLAIGRSISIWDAANGTKLISIETPDFIKQASWNKNGSHILTTEGDGTVRIWDAMTGTELIAFTSMESLEQASWNRDGSRILTVSTPYNQISTDGSVRVLSSSSTLRIWDVATGKVLLTLPFRHLVNQASWNEKEDRILTANADGTTRIYDAITGTELLILPHDGWVTYASWNKDESQIVTVTTKGGKGTVSVWDERTHQLRFEIQYEDTVTDVDWIKDGAQILVAHGTEVTFHVTNLIDLHNLACARAARNMTRAEWTLYMGDTPYRPTCDGKPYQDENGQWVPATEP